MSFDYGERWADVEGESEVALLCWGSTTGPAREALERHRADGERARLIALRLLSPVQPERMASALEGVERLVVVDQTYGEQLLGYLRAMYALSPVVVSHARPGPVPFTAAELHEVLRRRPVGTPRAGRAWRERGEPLQGQGLHVGRPPDLVSGLRRLRGPVGGDARLRDARETPRADRRDQRDRLLVAAAASGRRRSRAARSSRPTIRARRSLG